VEFADVIILNKSDLVSRRELAELHAIITRLNPGAELLPATHCGIPVNKVLLTGRFQLEAASRAPGWLAELRGTHVPETLEFGVSSFVFRSRVPFHPQRLWALIRGESSPALRCVVRSKGFAWLAVDGGMDECALWSSAGRVWQLSRGRAWWSTVDESAWPSGVKELVQQDWDSTFGDRRTEIVFIGMKMEEDLVLSALEAACITSDESALSPAAWDLWDDPFDFFPYESEISSDGGVEMEEEHVHGDDCSHSEPRATVCRIIA
jgi:G3E family GTPase